MLDEAKTFLARAVPWPTERDDWWINIHHTWLPPGAEKPVMPGRAFKKIEDALAEVERLERGNPTNIYVCMAGQAQTKADIGKVNNAERSSEYSVAFRSLRLDVDLVQKRGDTTVVIFGSTKEALMALAKFCDDSGLPMPTYIVLSGSGGFHAHWVTDEVMDQATWTQLAEALKNACFQCGFTVDGKSTTDAARVLRIPNTHNWKEGIGRAVKLFYDGIAYGLNKLWSTLARFFSPSGVVPSRTVSTTGPALGFVAGSTVPIVRRKPRASKWANIGDVARVPFESLLEGGCEWIKHVAKYQGKDQPEPLWREALAVAYYTLPDEARSFAHWLSAGHPGYSWAETERKYDRIEQDRNGGKYGWPQCRTIHGAGADECRTCPLLAKGKSPINHAKVDDPPTSTTAPLTADGNVMPPVVVPNNDLPKNWNRDHDGKVYMQAKLDKDDPTPVNIYAANLPIWNMRGQRPGEKDSNEGRSVFFLTELNKDELKEICVPVGATHDQRTLMAALSTQGFVVPKECRQPFEKLMTSFIERLRTQSVQVTENLGWSSENGVENAFVYNKTRWNCAGDTPVGQAASGIAGFYMPTGQMDVWQRAAGLVFDRHRPDLEAIMSTAFAAPLVALTGHSGLIVSAYSNKSGVGKTTSLRVGAATWGHPTNSMAGIETPNYLNKLLAMLRHLPLFYDEARTSQDMSGKMAELLMTVGLGRVKGRLSRSSTILPVENYNTILMAASNNSLFDYISEHTKTTVAGIMRIFEFEAERPDMGPLVGLGDAQMLVGALDKNYGHAGLEYAKFLGRNADHVRQEIKASSDKFAGYFHATQEERFWISAMVTMRVGALLANKIGVTRFDERGLVEFLATEFERMRRRRQTSTTDINQPDTLVGYLTGYLNDMRPFTVRTDVMMTRSVKRAQLKGDTRLVRLPVRVHVAEDDKLLRLSAVNFREWLKDQKVGEHYTLVRRMIETGLVSAPRSPLTLGQDHLKNTGREWVLEVDLSKYPDLID